MTLPDFVLAGQWPDTSGEAFTFDDSEYADDTALLYCSRADAESQGPPLMEHFADWGMEVHAGTDTKGSKTEVLFCPAPLHTYTDPTTYDGVDLSDVQLGGGRSWPVVEKFSYLGDMVERCGGDASAVAARITAAGKAFGALRGCLFSSTSVSRAAKAAAYEGIVLSILLFGSESWCLTEMLRQRLRVFHAMALRAMCRVSRKHTWEHHIATEDLMSQLGLDGMEYYVARRQLGWLGHVARMPASRLPRQMLSAWVPHPRPVGAPRMTYGRSISKAFDVFGLHHTDWPSLAADRVAWREMLRSGHAPPIHRAAPSTPAALPIALTRPRRALATVTNAKIRSSLAAYEDDDL